MRREDEDFDASPTPPASSGSAPAKRPTSSSSGLTPRVVRVGDDGVRSGWDYERLRVRCYRCPKEEPAKPVSELTLGLCAEHWKVKQQREAEELRSYLSKLRGYAEATGDKRASDYADYLEEGDAAALSDPRREAFSGHAHDLFNEWRNRQ